jgi:poly(A) polymerase Pap1
LFSWDDVPNLPADSPLFSLPQSSLVTLNAYRDVVTIRRVLPSLDAFRVAHRALKLFLTQRGFSGARFGYLGGFHLTLLLTRVALSLPHTADASHLVAGFLGTYAKWDWAKDVVYPIPSRSPETGSNPVYKRVLHKEPMVILSIERPLSNLSFHASWNSVEALSRGIKEAHQLLEEGKTWPAICGSLGNPVDEFISAYKLFIKLEVSFWGGNCMKGRALIGWLESRIVNVRKLLTSDIYAC